MVYNKKHLPRTFAVSDRILLFIRNLRLRRPNKKLSERYLGPFTIIDIIGRQAYKFQLPTGY